MAPIDKLYDLCKDITKDQSVLLFNFIEIYNNMIDYDEFNEFNDIVIDLFEMACINNNHNLINNIIDNVYDNIIDLDVMWLIVNVNKCNYALYYLIKKYRNRYDRIHSAFMDTNLCDCSPSKYLNKKCNININKYIAMI
jgi:hypothetical protein